MDTKSVVAQYRGEQWIQILQELKESGKTVKVFCRERNLSLNAYYYWQRKLREAALENLQKSSSSSNIAPKGWMQLAEVNSAKCTAVEKHKHLMMECRYFAGEPFYSIVWVQKLNSSYAVFCA